MVKIINRKKGNEKSFILSTKERIRGLEELKKLFPEYKHSKKLEKWLKSY